MEFYVASNPKDVELEALITRRIHVLGFSIHVVVEGGQVTLFGSVDGFETKRLIDTQVRGIGSVRYLKNTFA